MGALLKALSPRSSYGAKNENLWQQLMDELTDCVTTPQIDAFEVRLDTRPLDYPAAWHTPLREKIAAQREYVASEDPNEIVRDRFNF